MKIPISVAVLLVLVIAAIPGESLASGGKLIGVVRDSLTAKPLVDVRITLIETKQSFGTDEDGCFYFLLPTGVYSIGINAVGYNRARVRNIPVEQDCALTILLALPPQRPDTTILELPYQTHPIVYDFYQAKQVSPRGVGFIYESPADTDSTNRSLPDSATIKARSDFLKLPREEH